MTDEQIMKALECCGDSNCNECPIEGCTDDIFGEALDLINRQKAELNNLKAEIAEHKAMLEAFDNELVSLDKAIKTEKSEAIKEFVGTVRKYIKSNCNPYSKPTLDYDTSVKIMHFIDNLVKEMTDVETNQRKEDDGK